MSGASPTPSDALLHQQRAVLLQQLAAAPDGKLSQADANKSIPAQIKSELQLTPAALKSLRQTMVLSGWVAEEKVGRAVSFSVTEVGKHQLGGLERHLPLLPAKGKAAPAPDERTRAGREAYVLDALARADDRTLSKAAVAGLKTQLCLGLNPATARAVLTALAARGDVLVRRSAGSESYALTPSGAETLTGLRAECPVLPPPGKPAPAGDERTRRTREAAVLLHLLQCADHTLWGADAHLGKKGPFGLNHATVWEVRGALARAGHVALTWDGSDGKYTLTASGLRYLTTLPLNELGEIKIKGAALIELLAAGREGVAPAAPLTQAPPPPAAPEHLETAVLDIFRELFRERFAVTGLVPIHEIRKEVSNRHGGRAASHAVLDELLLDLRRAQKVKLVSISDRSRATAEQLQDSVISVGETFFYAEQAHDHATSG